MSKNPRWRKPPVNPPPQHGETKVSSPARASSTRPPRYQDGLNRFLCRLLRIKAQVFERDRVTVLSQIVHHMTDQLTVMGLWYNTEPVPIGNRLQNVTPSDVGGATSAWNAHLWDTARL